MRLFNRLATAFVIVLLSSCFSSSYAHILTADCYTQVVMEEICDNGIDDDGDGAIDCDDSDLVNDCCCTDRVVKEETHYLCEGQSVTVNGAIYTLAGIYSVTESVQGDCETILNFEIVEIPAVNIDETFTVCSNESVRVHGLNYFLAGKYTLTFPDAFGCDTIYNFEIEHLPLPQKEKSLYLKEATVVFNGISYDTPGQYTQQLPATVGCDTLCTINVYPGDCLREEIYYLCEGQSVEVYGFTYTLPGIYLLDPSITADCPEKTTFEVIELPLVELSDTFTVCEGESVEVAGLNYFAPGNYILTYPELLGGCDTTYRFTINHLVVPEQEKIFYLTEDMSSVDVNGITYDSAGQYMQNIPATTGCDTVCVIKIYEEKCIVSYDMDACYSSVTLGSHDYSEFEPEYSEVLSCGTVVASEFIRVHPLTNVHSCTEGLDGTTAICISSEESCDFVESSEKAGRIALTITPEAGSEIIISKLSFAQMAPLMYSWSHSSGPNNYPTKYGVKILQDGLEIFSALDMPTAADWTHVEFDLGMDIVISSASGLEIQFLGYCLIGNGSDVSAFDLENIKIYGACKSSAQERILAGRVALQGEQSLESVIVESAGFDFRRMTETDSNGAYAFGNAYDEASYLLAASLDEDHLAGVSTIDLVMIQRHILGLELIDSPLQLIAADVNNDQAINGIDLVELRKLILGIYTEFPRNESYRFFDRRSVENAETTADLVADIIVEPSSDNNWNLDFTGVKIGDVNGSGLAAARMATRSAKALNLEIEDRIVEEGQEITIPVFAKDANELIGLQTTLSFNPTVLEFVGFEKAGLNITEAHLGLQGLAEGNISLSWSSATSKDVTSDEPLFELTFYANATTKLSEHFFLSSVQTNSEAYDAELEAMPLSLSYKGAELSEFNLYQNTPNPFADKTEIRFSLPASSEVVLRIFTVNGAEVLKKASSFEAGMNVLSLNREALNSSGVMYYQLETAFGTATKKMIQLR